MIIPPTPPPLPTAQTSQTPQQNNAVAVAVAAGQTAAKTVQTQTARAPAPVGRAEKARDAQDGTKVGHSVDSEAQAVRARTPGRGDKLDVSV